ncbi:MAG TPA: hypothetical protein VGF94_09115 [Kofleriaceae bacterium]|jgi:tetratricopeptide (TPR) repeat protein
MRRAIWVLLALAATADARPPRRHAADLDPDRGDFWRAAVEPHADEVWRLVVRARQTIQEADLGLSGDYDPAGEQRAKFYRAAYDILRDAQRLSPENLDVLRLLGIAADELGRTREAEAALQTAVRVAGGERVGPEVTGLLGAIELRLGHVDTAIRWLRAARADAAPGSTVAAHAAVTLATALASRGDSIDAIDELANSLPSTVGYYTNELALVSFALAVQYDRDDQPSAALDVLDRMQNAMQPAQYAAQVQAALASIRWALPEDRHYHLALLYDSMGQYTEARAEWALYAASGNAPFRARALAHIAAIDARSR